MNPKYFKDQICDELDGACDYLKKAIDCMKSHPEWSKKFKTMSEAEEHHATELYKMFMDWYTDNNQDGYAQSIRECIMGCFSESMRKLEDYKVTYEMMSKEDMRAAAMTSAKPTSSPILNNVTTL